MSNSLGFYSQPEGLPSLREAIAQHVSFSRGVVCVDEDIVVCNGAQQALDLIARVLIQPGNIVAMEDPGYTPARLVFSAQGAQVASIPVDSEGICVELISPVSVGHAHEPGAARSAIGAGPATGSGYYRGRLRQ
jgi:GntR family transcriptional regulator/MocR family aminotransferase